MNTHNVQQQEAALADMYDYIAGYIGQNNRPPTKREIMRNCGISSTSLVHYRLIKLQNRGLIRITPYISRGIALAQKQA